EWAYRGIGMTLCLGFMQLKGLERAFVNRVLEERQQRGLYRSFHDFLSRLNPEPAQTRLLILAGSFDAIAGEVTRPGLLWRLYANHPLSGLSSQQSALRHATPLIPTSPTLPIPHDYPMARKIQHEIQLFGFPLQCHPLTLYAKNWSHLNLTQAIEMPARIGESITMVGWLITEKPAITKHGESMVFLTLEDTTGLYDATMFPNVFQQYGPLLTNERPLLLQGKVEEEFGAMTMTITKLQIVGQENRQEIPA
ncbi:MAG: OB-fold nucleic acid binding domain-containing protein, partial [Nitrospirota bacterium]|nr:OB-fold nucleic acid binding domain-containing protein [Nitrospirota bacterium]